MKVTGIIAEYNPFHSGHRYQLEQARENGATHIAVAMSGNYVQRGDIAIFSKWARAAAALKCGADLVVELPTPFAMSSAEKFAGAGVFILSSLCCDELYFGSESGDINDLDQTALILKDEQLNDAIKENLKGGRSYAAARSLAVMQKAGIKYSQILETPNNILAVEYIKAINEQRSKMKPATLKRKGADYHSFSEAHSFASATLVRTLISGGEFGKAERFIPQQALNIFKSELEQGFSPCKADKLDTALLALLRRASRHELEQIEDISEGLENRILQKCIEALSFDELCESIKTKRYARTRINRILWSAVLGLNKSLCAEYPPYIKVLALNSRGREIIATAKTTVPIISKPAAIGQLNDKAKALFSFECKATDLYALSSPVPRRCGLETLISPYYEEV